MSPRIGLDLPTILEAATEIADTQGFDQVTLAAIAQKFNIRPPSLYNHVNGLQGIRQLLKLHGLTILHSNLSQAVQGKNGDEAVHALSDVYMAFARMHPGLYEATIPAPEVEDQEAVMLGEQIVRIFIEVLQTYGLDQEMSIHATRGLRSICHGFASLEQQGGFGIPLDLDLSQKLVLNSFLAGLQQMKNLL
ncbi:TetR/AcrR family transcriptional regulator [Paenibacillus sp. N1-5-1-14]|uniref:TetR/AcrR family transcriptional regulator n=1 Tax=Paenibacillus radicibacter TaxID=2972488 RepID=UPI0021597F22|nr:TetR/AcrR family transcriptional regulator [Paenibacillus radicibacter]MCR8641217.1 TetR/AcrR family transcriptional regulator [Paenibacillus radicibacter]